MSKLSETLFITCVKFPGGIMPVFVDTVTLVFCTGGGGLSALWTTWTMTSGRWWHNWRPWESRSSGTGIKGGGGGVNLTQYIAFRTPLRRIFQENVLYFLSMLNVILTRQSLSSVIVLVCRVVFQSFRLSTAKYSVLFTYKRYQTCLYCFD